ncbi:uncharacterized protein LOC115623117 [Scaptodrosophila lebanonensis]|uniref:Uncharacterized protein LOC115623117 n=1 Tax=Drosophila lebanonensis TaxID=7225 RepID=A0A6J2TAX2_DROLE|nr:uncharacterized protein LOC115623117 [Scaptodrosophila lebanonensis]
MLLKLLLALGALLGFCCSWSSNCVDAKPQWLATVPVSYATPAWIAAAAPAAAPAASYYPAYAAYAYTPVYGSYATYPYYTYLRR